MCGLVGVYSSNMLMRHRDALEDLLYLDTLRGRDSTGVATIRHNSDTEIQKATIPGFEFIENQRLDRFLKLNDVCWIGHNRYGTVGKNIRANAHPFMIYDDDGGVLLVGAHNGTLKNKHALDDHHQFGTDSEALLNQIAFKGVKETIEQVEGAWALVWYDHMEEELRFLRNKERTLFYAYEDDHKTLIWASEMWMIRVACSRRNIKIEDDKVYSFAEDTLYRFPVPLKMNEKLTCEREGGHAGKAPGFFRDWDRERWNGGSHGPRTQPETKTETPSQTRPGSSSTSTALAVVEAARQAHASTSFASGTQTPSNGEKQTTKSDASSKAQSKSEPDNVVGIDNAKKFKGYGGKLLTKRELENQLANGCGWCELEFIDVKDQFGWLAPEKPICSKCLSGVAEEPKKESKLAPTKTVH